MNRNIGHLRLFADVECLLEQLDETKFDGNISSGPVLTLRDQPQSSVVRKVGAHLNDLEYVGIDSDGQVLSGNWWVWRHSDALQLTVRLVSLIPDFSRARRAVDIACSTDDTQVADTIHSHDIRSKSTVDVAP